jgi:hypothetical protein
MLEYGKRGDDMEEQRVCEHCDSPMGADDSYCASCQSVCERCEDIVDNGDTCEVDNQTWCESCVDNHSFYCEHCSDRYNSNRVGYTWFDDCTYCEDCIGEVASWCERCDEWENSDSECFYDDEEDRVVKNYSYKPSPIFQGDSKNMLWLGWELEAQIERGSLVEPAIYANAKLDGLAYLKEDGSLRNGFEIVTHPIAHNLLREKELDRYWDTIEQLRTTYGMRSWDVRTNECGLHVHVSRTGFSGSLHKHMFLRLIYGNPEMMAKFAGRLSRYSTFSDIWTTDEYGVPYRNYSNKLKGGGERNSAVNVYPEHTIEVRFFRGTLSKEGILACLDLVQACVEYTRHLTSKDVMLGALTWDMFYEYIHDNNGIYPSAYARMPRVTSVNLKNVELIQA